MKKTLIGSSVNLDAIWNRIRVELNFGGHRNEALQTEWKEFGEEAFRFEILSEIKKEDSRTSDHNRDVKKLEEMLIEIYSHMWL